MIVNAPQSGLHALVHHVSEEFERPTAVASADEAANQGHERVFLDHNTSGFSVTPIKTTKINPNETEPQKRNGITKTKRVGHATKRFCSLFLYKTAVTWRGKIGMGRAVYPLPPAIARAVLLFLTSNRWGFKQRARFTFRPIKCIFVYPVASGSEEWISGSMDQSLYFVCTSFTADGSQRARLPIPPTAATLPSS